MVGWHLLALLVIEVIAYGGFGFYAHRAWGWPYVHAVALSVTIYLAVRVLLVAAEFLLARHNGDPIPVPLRQPAWRLLTMYLRELAGWIVMFSIVMPFVGARRSVIDRSQVRRLMGACSGGLPIILVHGLACNRGNWLWCRRQLERRGLRAYAVDYTPWFATIDVYAPQLAVAIDEVRSATGAEKVIVVGHSMGGLVTRAYLDRFGSANVAHVITLGTPHQGTWMTRFGFTPNVRNMATDSAWLAALREREAQRSSDPYGCFTCVFTYHDNLVSPQHNATLPGAKQIPLSGIGHLSLAISPLVVDRIVDVVAGVSATAGAAHDAT